MLDRLSLSVSDPLYYFPQVRPGKCVLIFFFCDLVAGNQQSATQGRTGGVIRSTAAAAAEGASRQPGTSAGDRYMVNPGGISGGGNFT